DVVDQTGPQVPFDVVPGVEIDLHDALPERRIALVDLARLVVSRELIDTVLDRVEKVALARTPVAEEADSEWWFKLPRREQIRERIHLGGDADEVFDASGVRRRIGVA